MQAFGSGERGRVVVAYGASAGYETAPELLRRLAEQHPHVELATELRGSGAILAGLRDGSVDLGLVRCPPDAPTRGRTVRAERQGVLVRRGHRLAERRRRRRSASWPPRRCCCTRGDANPGHYDAVLALCRDAGVEPYVQERALSFDLAQTPVLTGQAVAIVGESTRIGLRRRAPLDPARPARRPRRRPAGPPRRALAGRRPAARERGRRSPRASAGPAMRPRSEAMPRRSFTGRPAVSSVVSDTDERRRACRWQPTARP